MIPFLCKTLRICICNQRFCPAENSRCNSLRSMTTICRVFWRKSSSYKSTRKAVVLEYDWRMASNAFRVKGSSSSGSPFVFCFLDDGSSTCPSSAYSLSSALISLSKKRCVSLKQVHPRQRASNDLRIPNQALFRTLGGVYQICFKSSRRGHWHRMRQCTCNLTQGIALHGAQDNIRGALHYTNEYVYIFYIYLCVILQD